MFFPSLLRVLRRGVTIATAWRYQRFWTECTVILCNLCICVDPRATDSHLLEVCQTFSNMPCDKLDPAFSLKLQKFLEPRGQADVRCILIVLWLQRLLLQWSWSVLPSISDVTVIHGRNRRRTAQYNSLSTFAEVLTRVNQNYGLQLWLSYHPKRILQVNRRHLALKKTFRKRSAWDWLLAECGTSQKAVGRTFKIRRQQDREEAEKAWREL